MNDGLIHDEDDALDSKYPSVWPPMSIDSQGCLTVYEHRYNVDETRCIGDFLTKCSELWE